MGRNWRVAEKYDGNDDGLNRNRIFQELPVRRRLFIDDDDDDDDDDFEEEQPLRMEQQQVRRPFPRRYDVSTNTSKGELCLKNSIYLLKEEWYFNTTFVQQREHRFNRFSIIFLNAFIPLIIRVNSRVRKGSCNFLEG